MPTLRRHRTAALRTAVLHTLEPRTLFSSTSASLFFLPPIQFNTGGGYADQVFAFPGGGNQNAGAVATNRNSSPVVASGTLTLGGSNLNNLNNGGTFIFYTGGSITTGTVIINGNITTYGNITTTGTFTNGEGGILHIGSSGTIPQNSPLQITSTGIASVTQPPTITVTVSPTSSTTGTITLYDGITLIASAPLVNGSATFQPLLATAGNHTLTAYYSGDGNNPAALSNPFTQYVNPLQATLSLTGPTTPVLNGTQVPLTLTATSDTGAPLDGVQVQWRDADWAGYSILGTSTITNGTATFNWEPTIAGPHNLYAEIISSPTYAGDSNTLLAQSYQITTSTTLSGPVVNTLPIGIPTTITAQVTADHGASLEGLSVSLYDSAVSNSMPVAFGTIHNGVADIPWIPTTYGFHSLYATFGDGIAYSQSTSNDVYENVGKSVTAVSISDNAATVDAGGQITINVQASSQTGSPDGQIAELFEETANGPMHLAQATIANGTATFNGYAPAGTHQYIVALLENANDYSATSNAVTVTAVPSAVTLTLNPTSSADGSSAMGLFITASSVDPVAIAPTGNVQFYEGNTPVASVVLGQLNQTTNDLSPGEHTLTAVYTGDANFLPTESTVDITIPGNTGSSASPIFVFDTSPAQSTPVVQSLPTPHDSFPGDSDTGTHHALFAALPKEHKHPAITPSPDSVVIANPEHVAITWSLNLTTTAAAPQPAWSLLFPDPSDDDAPDSSPTPAAAPADAPPAPPAAQTPPDNDAATDSDPQTSAAPSTTTPPANTNVDAQTPPDNAPVITASVANTPPAPAPAASPPKSTAKSPA